MNIKSKRDQLVAALSDKDYRDAFVAEEVSTGITFQIREMRLARGWDQGELAERASTAQPVISRFENPNADGRFSISTLRQLASAFDVGLIVRFAPFSELVDHALDLGNEQLAVQDFDQEKALSATGTEQARASIDDDHNFDIPVERAFASKRVSEVRPISSLVTSGLWLLS